MLKYFDNATPSSIAVIGDRVLTDVVYGNGIGSVTILTWNIISKSGDNAAAAIVYALRIFGFQLCR